MLFHPTDHAFTRFRARALAQAPVSHNAGWEDVLVPYGMARAGHALKDEALLDWARAWFDRHDTRGCVESADQPYIHSRADNVGFLIADYCGNWGAPLVFAQLHRARPDARLPERARQVCEAFLRQGTGLPDGAFSHGGFDYGRRTLWVDTLFYTSSVLAETFAITGERRYAAEAIKQALLHARWLQDPTTGGFFHDATPATGVRTDYFWARGNGWVILSLIDTLRLCPSDLPGWTELLASYRSLVTCLLRYQHASGLWRIVPECPDAHLETSGSAMILAGIAGGLSAGWIDAGARAPVLRGYRELLTWIDGHGALQGAQRPAGVGGWDIHKLSTMGECTYANGLLWRLFADLAEAGLVNVSAPGAA